jgi:hypothetical protein
MLGVDFSSAFLCVDAAPPRPRPLELLPRPFELPRNVLPGALVPRPRPAAVPPLTDDMVIDLRLP